MTLAKIEKAHSLEEPYELVEKFDIDEYTFCQIREQHPHKDDQDLVKQVLREAEGVYKYYWNEKFELHQVEKLVQGKEASVEAVKGFLKGFLKDEVNVQKTTEYIVSQGMLPEE